jgi:hypothetical protein
MGMRPQYLLIVLSFLLLSELEGNTMPVDRNKDTPMTAHLEFEQHTLISRLAALKGLKPGPYLRMLVEEHLQGKIEELHELRGSLSMLESVFEGVDTSEND